MNSSSTADTLLLIGDVVDEFLPFTDVLSRSMTCRYAWVYPSLTTAALRHVGLGSWYRQCALHAPLFQDLLRKARPLDISRATEARLIVLRLMGLSCLTDEPDPEIPIPWELPLDIFSFDEHGETREVDVCPWDSIMENVTTWTWNRRSSRFQKHGLAVQKTRFTTSRHYNVGRCRPGEPSSGMVLCILFYHVLNL